MDIFPKKNISHYKLLTQQNKKALYSSCSINVPSNRNRTNSKCIKTDLSSSRKPSLHHLFCSQMFTFWLLILLSSTEKLTYLITDPLTSKEINRSVCWLLCLEKSLRCELLSVKCGWDSVNIHSCSSD